MISCASSLHPVSFSFFPVWAISWILRAVTVCGRKKTEKKKKKAKEKGRGKGGGRLVGELSFRELTDPKLDELALVSIPQELR